MRRGGKSTCCFCRMIGGKKAVEAKIRARRSVRARPPIGGVAALSFSKGYAKRSFLGAADGSMLCTKAKRITSGENGRECRRR